MIRDFLARSEKVISEPVISQPAKGGRQDETQYAALITGYCFTDYFSPPLGHTRKPNGSVAVAKDMTPPSEVTPAKGSFVIN